MFPKSRALMEADTHFWALLNISLRVPSKGALISCLINKLSLGRQRKQIPLVGKTIKVLAPALCWICLSWHKCFVLKTWSTKSKFCLLFNCSFFGPVPLYYRIQIYTSFTLKFFIKFVSAEVNVDKFLVKEPLFVTLQVSREKWWFTCF